MEYINEMYDKGYFKALLDVRNEIEYLTNNLTNTHGQAHGFPRYKVYDRTKIKEKVRKNNSKYDEIIN